MINGLDFRPTTLPPEAEKMRKEVRTFLAAEQKAGTFKPASNAWAAGSPKFSKRCGEAGFIAVTWPKEYGGHERSALERFVVVEEMLAAGAPVGFHWVADRQSGPQIMRHGSERAKREILHRIAAGECCFGIGMSEPDTGSDLAGVSTRAEKVEGGYSITGRKVWTSLAHMAHYLILLARTSPKTEDRHKGLTQFVIDMSKPGVTVRPIPNIAQKHEFNEVTFDNYFVPDDMVVAGEGRGWEMVTGELAFERSSPDRFLSNHPLFMETIDALGPNAHDYAAAEVGRLIAQLATMRRMSISIAGMLEAGGESGAAGRARQGARQ